MRGRISLSGLSLRRTVHLYAWAGVIRTKNNNIVVDELSQRVEKEKQQKINELESCEEKRQMAIAICILASYCIQYDFRLRLIVSCRNNRWQLIDYFNVLENGCKKLKVHFHFNFKIRVRFFVSQHLRNSVERVFLLLVFFISLSIKYYHVIKYYRISHMLQDK